VKLKLYVWDEFHPDLYSGLAFAIAVDESEARQLIEKELGYSPSNWGMVKRFPLNSKIAKAVSGGM
jgi:hypothetical protein